MLNPAENPFRMEIPNILDRINVTCLNSKEKQVLKNLRSLSQFYYNSSSEIFFDIVQKTYVIDNDKNPPHKLPLSFPYAYRRILSQGDLDWLKDEGLIDNLRSIGPFIQAVELDCSTVPVGLGRMTITGKRYDKLLVPYFKPLLLQSFTRLKDLILKERTFRNLNEIKELLTDLPSTIQFQLDVVSSSPNALLQALKSLDPANNVVLIVRRLEIHNQEELVSLHPISSAWFKASSPKSSVTQLEVYLDQDSFRNERRVMESFCQLVSAFKPKEIKLDQGRMETKWDLMNIFIRDNDNAGVGTVNLESLIIIGYSGPLSFELGLLFPKLHKLSLRLIDIESSFLSNSQLSDQKNLELVFKGCGDKVDLELCIDAKVPKFKELIPLIKPLVKSLNVW